jgi:hypothetical protein
VLEEKTTLRRIYSSDYTLFKCYGNFSVSILNIFVYIVQTVVSYVLIHNIYVNEDFFVLELINVIIVH